MTGTASPSFRGGKGSPLVLIHGLSMAAQVWDPVIPFLRPKHEVHALTLPGHHGGALIEAGHEVTIGSITSAVCTQLDEIGLQSAHLAGNSLGGWIALEVARRGRAKSVTALSPAGAWSSSYDATRLSYLLLVGAAVTRRPLTQRLMSNRFLRSQMLRKLAERSDTMTPQQIKAVAADMSECTILKDLLSHVKRSGPIPALHPAPCPIRLAWSGEDKTLPYRRYGRPMLHAIPEAELLFLPGVGHVPMYDNPRLVADTIISLTQRLDSTRS